MVIAEEIEVQSTDLKLKTNGQMLNLLNKGNIFYAFQERL